MAARGRKVSTKTKEKFLANLADAGNVRAAAYSVGVGRNTPYVWKSQDPEFAKKWDQALEEATDKLEEEARRRALLGVDEPVYQSGRLVGHVKKYSDTLLIFLLKGQNPQKYRDRWQGELSTNGNIRVQFIGADDEEGLTPEG